MMPVHIRVVDAQLQSLLAALTRQFFQRIAMPGTRLHDAVVGQFGVEQAEAVVVLGREDHVLHPGSLRKLCPCTREARLRFELPGKLLVLLKRNCLCLHCPFMTAVLAVGTEMNEHSELCRVPPLHAAELIGRGGNGIGVALACGRRGRFRWGLCVAADSKRCERGSCAEQHIAPAQF